MMLRCLAITIALIAINKSLKAQEIVAPGQMPNLIASEHSVHMVFGRNDSVLYTVSTNGGKSFDAETVVAVIPDLAASHTRGPQVAATNDEIVVTACSAQGDIFSFVLDNKKQVIARTKVNDTDTTAKENLMSLSADGKNVFATWLDLRSGHNQIYGAASTDGGRTWGKNIKVYSSPDTTVCECCKPSVEVHENDVYVMFRNWLNGYRDLYVVRSSDNGKSFGEPQKIGSGSWKLAGCPMDGGDLSVIGDTEICTVFNREGAIFSCTLGQLEKQIGSGRSCTMDASAAKKIYAWVEKPNVVYLNAAGRKTVLGQGQLPVIKVIDATHALCVWENSKQIIKAVVEL